MSRVTDAIKTRRSIRKYSARKISAEGISEILEAARWAPSAHNAQPWRLIVLIDETLKRNLAEAMANAWMADLIKDGTPAEVRENMTKASVERFTHASVLIVACITMNDMIQYADEPRKKCEHHLAGQ